jgi:hypothetical protein
VARALSLPRVLLLLRFGVSQRPSRPYTALVGSYREALGGGLQAGRFAARPLAPTEQDEPHRDEFLGQLSGTLADVASQLQTWSERSLDRLRLPHPGLGLLTVREMVMFTIYHNSHHVLGVARRSQSCSNCAGST